MLFSQFVRRITHNGKRLKLPLIDVTKAYFNAKPLRNLFVRVPSEMGLPSGTLGNLTDAAMVHATQVSGGKRRMRMCWWT